MNARIPLLVLLLSACTGRLTANTDVEPPQAPESDGGTSDARAPSDLSVPFDAPVIDDDASTLDPTGDPDHDYLTNAEESAAGTNPLNADTDGDGYLDGDETLEGKDPLDPESRIYTGGWAYNRNKASIVPPDRVTVGSCVEGAIAPHFRYVDQFGELVDLYDLGGRGESIIIEVGGRSCGRCTYLTNAVTGAYSDTSLTPQIANMKRLLDSGSVRLAWFLMTDLAGAPATVEDAADYAESVPNTPFLLPNGDNQVSIWFGSWSTPGLIMLSPDMRVTICNGRMESFLDELYERFPPP